MSTTRPLRKTQAYELDDRLRYGNYAYAKVGANQPIILQTISSLTALPTVSQGEVSSINTGYDHPRIDYFQTTAQTLQPVQGTVGIVLDGDQVNNETQEYVIGGNNAANPFAFKVGTDPDFFFRARLRIDVSNGSDQLIVGWRKQEAFQVPTSFLTTGDPIYTDVFGVGFAHTVATPNIVYTSSDVADAGSCVATSTLFGWTSTKVHDLEVRVVGGKAQVYINKVKLGNPIAKDGLGNAITSQPTAPVASYTFGAGLVLIPFIFVRQDAAVTTAVELYEYEVGHLLNIGLDPNNEQ